MTARIQVPKKLEPIFTTDKRFIFTEGGRGGGKSHSIARALLIKGMKSTRRILCTREIQKSIGESVYKLLVDIINEYKLPYYYTNTTIKCAVTDTEFFFAGLQGHTVNSIKSFEGIDDCWIEEGQTISKYSIDILIPTIRKEGSKIYISMNRMEEIDPLYEKFILSERDDVLHIKINYYENPFCTQVIKDEAAQCRLESEEDYQHIWEGSPITQGDKCILSLVKVKDAMNRKIEAVGGLEAGVDVARFGDDKTVISLRRGLKCLVVREFSKLRTYEVAQKTIGMLKEFAKKDENIKDCSIKVDDTGVGGGVTDELFRQCYRAVAVNNGQTAKNKDKYDSAITEMFYDMRDMLDDIELPNDQQLLREMTTRQFDYDRLGRKKVEAKDKYKKRYKKSPDKSDSVLLCFYNYHKCSGILML